MNFRNLRSDKLPAKDQANEYPSILPSIHPSIHIYDNERQLNSYIQYYRYMLTCDPHIISLKKEINATQMIGETCKNHNGPVNLMLIMPEEYPSPHDSSDILLTPSLSPVYYPQTNYFHHSLPITHINAPHRSDGISSGFEKRLCGKGKYSPGELLDINLRVPVV